MERGEGKGRKGSGREENGTVRQTVYDFLLTFHSIAGPIYCSRFRYTARYMYWSKVAIFSYP